MERNIVIRPSELVKVPVYTERLQLAISRAQEIGLDNSLKEWAEEITKRRLEWLALNQNTLSQLTGPEVRKGMELVLFRYMGIPPEEVEVIEDSPSRITWYARDFCPYLEATRSVGLDPRIVCRLVTESPCQAMLCVLNPDLLFSRNYSRIRPHVDYCEETIELRATNP